MIFHVGQKVKVRPLEKFAFGANPYGKTRGVVLEVCKSYDGMHIDVQFSKSNNFFSSYYQSWWYMEEDLMPDTNFTNEEEI